MAHAYSTDFEDALNLFEEVSCCKKQLKMALENK